MQLTWRMPSKQHIITLTAEERADLVKVSNSTRRGILEKKRARILLGSDTSVSRELGGSMTDAELSKRYKSSPLTVSTVRRRAHERGALASIKRADQANRSARRLDGAGEAHLIALACSAPPDGHARWSLRLIRDRLIEMEVVEDIGQETIRQTLKKMSSNRG